MYDILSKLLINNIKEPVILSPFYKKSLKFCYEFFYCISIRLQCTVYILFNQDQI